MRDAVGEELGRRWSEPWPWRSALATAIALHFALAASLLLAPTHRKRSLQLPSVQVRMVPPLPSASGRPPRPAAQPRPAPPSPAPATRPAQKKPPVAVADVPRRSATRGAKTVAPPTPAPAPTTAPARGERDPGGAAGDTGAAGLRSPAGGIGLGAGNGGAEEPFPFAYYLTRFISLVESNWFRPPTPAETRCRVRCRIDRSGRLLEAGIEEPSGVATFDRAALRAIFASTPLPPLPQGFAGQTLTLHLDFGPG